MMAVTNATFGADSDFTSVARVLEGWAGVKIRSRPHKGAAKHITGRRLYAAAGYVSFNLVGRTAQVTCPRPLPS